MRFAILTALVALALAALAGCGSNDESETPRPSAEGAAAAEVARESGAELRAPAGASARRCPAPSGATDLRASRLGCKQARLLAGGWIARPACGGQRGSRSACTVAGFRCLAVSAGRGRSVSCARRGYSIAFLVRSD